MGFVHLRKKLVHPLLSQIQQEDEGGGGVLDVLRGLDSFHGLSLRHFESAHRILGVMALFPGENPDLNRRLDFRGKNQAASCGECARCFGSRKTGLQLSWE
jgi:hypothetical protein